MLAQTSSSGELLLPARSVLVLQLTPRSARLEVTAFIPRRDAPIEKSLNMDSGPIAGGEFGAFEVGFGVKCQRFPSVRGRRLRDADGKFRRSKVSGKVASGGVEGREENQPQSVIFINLSMDYL